MLLLLIIPSLQLSDWFSGLVHLHVWLLPLVLLVSGFIAVIGAANPAKPGLLRSWAIVLGYFYGSSLGIVAWVIIIGKCVDFIIGSQGLSWFGVIVAVILAVMAANIFVDHLFQIKQGNYRLSIYVFFIILAYIWVINWLAYSTTRII